MSQKRLNTLATTLLVITSTVYFLSAQILTSSPFLPLSKPEESLGKQLWAGYHTFYYLDASGALDLDLIEKTKTDTNKELSNDKTKLSEKAFNKTFENKAGDTLFDEGDTTLSHFVLESATSKTNLIGATSSTNAAEFDSTKFSTASFIEKVLNENGFGPVISEEAQGTPLLIKKDSIEYALKNLASNEYILKRENFFTDKTGTYKIFYVDDSFDATLIKKTLATCGVTVYFEKDEDAPAIQYKSLPTIADYAFYVWDVKTYPYRAVGSDFVAVDNKIEVCYDEYSDKQGLFEKQVVMSFDEDFVGRCLSDIAKLPPQSIEHLLQKNIAGLPLRTRS